MAGRTPEEIYAEIQNETSGKYEPGAADSAATPNGPAWLDARAARWVRVAALWEEMAQATIEHGAEPWQVGAVTNAAAYALGRADFWSEQIGRAVARAVAGRAPSA